MYADAQLTLRLADVGLVGSALRCDSEALEVQGRIIVTRLGNSFDAVSINDKDHHTGLHNIS